MNPSDSYTFIQCWDIEANKAQNLVAKRIFPNADSVRAFIASQYRRLEYRSHEPWNQADHGKRTIYPVPAKYVLFDPPKEIVVPPSPRGRSLLIQRKPFPRDSTKQSILKGV